VQHVFAIPHHVENRELQVPISYTRKKCGNGLSAQRVNQAVAAACPHHGMRLLQDEQPGSDNGSGRACPMRQLYNEVFLPCMRDFLEQEQTPADTKKQGPLKVCLPDFNS
jgi:hypothetical protein